MNHVGEAIRWGPTACPLAFIKPLLQTYSRNGRVWLVRYTTLTSTPYIERVRHIVKLVAKSSPDVIFYPVTSAFSACSLPAIL